MKDYTNSMSDTPLEEGAEIEVVIANINRKDQRNNPLSSSSRKARKKCSQR